MIADFVAKRLKLACASIQIALGLLVLLPELPGSKGISFPSLLSVLFSSVLQATAKKLKASNKKYFFMIFDSFDLLLQREILVADRT